MRFYLIDRVLEMDLGKSAVGIKCWSLDNEIFRDHFPGQPTVPGVLLTESMAQLGGVLLKYSYYEQFGKETKVYPVLSIIQKAKFRTFVKPGDQCLIKAEITVLDRGRANVKAYTYVQDEMVCEATLSFAIGTSSDLGNNPYIDKMEEYHFNILPKNMK
jgi:3-hydroxyacyl-[acyl-carrier-protein] dehydratase